MRQSEKALHTCVHCGFCTATCPTYVLLGDERDSPRRRIYLIKDMLETGRPATRQTVQHIDRCLSCLSCMTTCPSGVHYMHLVDHARSHIEASYWRPLPDRLIRWLLARILPYPGRFRLALGLGRLARPIRGVLRRLPALAPLAAMLEMVPAPGRRGAPSISGRPAGPHATSIEATRRRRVALLAGCAQPVLRPSINEAAARLLTRCGVDVVTPTSAGCCGALVHHLGRKAEFIAFARRNIDAWIGEIETNGLVAIVMTASGCGTTVKDYRFALRDDPAYAGKAARIAALTLDITEFLKTAELPIERQPREVVTYHAACSLQHGQQVKSGAQQMLTKAGFTVRDVPEGHLCCGSAGTYSILQPALSERLLARKMANIVRTKPEIIATGNIGCIGQLARTSDVPVVHTVELLDWSSGGPPPPELAPDVKRGPAQAASEMDGDGH
jgi:glycolate oxidase iron-sulfur subunit